MKKKQQPPPITLLRVSVLITIAAATAAVAVLVLIPGPIDAVMFELHLYEDNPDNSHLREATRLFEGKLVGPEGFAMDNMGNMYTGLADGRVIRFNDTDFTTIVRLGDLDHPPFDKCGLASQKHMCDRPLGLEFDPSNPNLLYIAESYSGIYQYNVETEEMRLLINSSRLPSGCPRLLFINDLVVLRNGSIFFTDTSSRFTRRDVLKEFYDGRPTGKLVHYNPVDDSLTVVLSGLSFANGLYQSTNEEFLLISETSACRITKYYLTGPRAGETEPFIKGLPGIPDNISPSSSGGLWVACMGTRHNGMYDMIGRTPWIRNLIVKLGIEEILLSVSPRDAMIIEYTEQGEKVRALYDLGAHNIRGVSEVLDTGSKLYLGSFDAPYLARMDL